MTSIMTKQVRLQDGRIADLTQEVELIFTPDGHHMEEGLSETFGEAENKELTDEEAEEAWELEEV